MNDIKELWEIFNERFSDTGLRKGVFAAPGRVNLIGEHTDYNDGFVLPMAIDKSIVMIAQLRDDKEVRAYSVDYDSEAVFSLMDLEFDQENIWVNYLQGVIDEIQKLDYYLPGMNLIFTGNIPKASGLSSSAALEVVTAYTISSLNELNIAPVEMALLCQRAENDFVGVNCGIMDQYISRLGKEGNALLIDCRSNEYELVPLAIEDFRVVICNSKVERGLVDSEYNKRREECGKATKFFAEKLDRRIKALRDVSTDELVEFSGELAAVTLSRARHVISENNRVLTAVSALKNNDLETFGSLMTESHISLRDDYQVSCQELDLLVDLALKQDGILGARMTGAGFGGCTVNLVARNRVDQFITEVKAGYQEATNIEPEMYVSLPADGAREL
ncbi:galactokinase [Halocella sp. SP3-1]|uniref:galactokinase n=1 Tax=Halocella sp. SP3-1 TaxID=2382161 RepID=UPI000F753874|nr:galactokinase [Halocella sp. SP3-1]AZO94411.1 galactokinase [Halocella sp. SP3-1]